MPDGVPNRSRSFIVAFAIDLDEPSEIASLILQRTPKYELFLPPDERGVRVCHEQHPRHEDAILLQPEWSKKRALIVSPERTYVLELTHVEKSELRAGGRCSGA